MPDEKHSEDASEPPESDEPPRAPMRVLVVHNQGLDEDGAEIAQMKACEDEIVDVAHIVEKVLMSLGHCVERLALGGETSPLDERVGRGDVDVVFNLVESLAGDASREPEIPALLAARGVPFTGNAAHALSLAFAKDRVRAALVAGGVPVARALVVDEGTPLPDESAVTLRPPLFVKPARVDGSIGIDQGSVVVDHAALAERVALLLRTFGGAVLVEEYLPGLEVNVAVSPDAESGLYAPTLLDFSGFKDGQWPVVTYAAKWVEGHEDYNCRSVALDDRIPPDARALALSIARDALRAIGADGYARVDMRLDREGRPTVIDVNPNPALHPEAGFALAFETIGVSFSTLIESILSHALARAARPEEVSSEASRTSSDRPRSDRRDARAGE